MKLSRFFGQVVHPKIKGKLVLCLFPRSASLKLALKMAANFRLGSTCGPQATASSGMELENAKEVDEFDDTGNSDPDKLLQCPYDKSHHIRASRFPYHLIKCGKNHPKLAKELKTCPFNARHQLPKDQFSAHVESCPNRRDSEDREDNNRALTWRLPVSTWVNTKMTEDWDEDSDMNPSPFILGVSAAFNENRKLRPNTSGDSSKKPSQFSWSEL